MSTTAPPTAPVKVKTAYHILEEKTDAQGAKFYEPIAANIQANGTDDAIRSNVKAAGTYVAIPARSFQPRKVKLETQTVVKLT